MERIDHFSQEALAWVRFVLNPETPMPQISDWQAVYDFADKQKITGICNPSDYSVSIQRDLLFKWLGESQQIKIRSALLNQRTVTLYTLLQEAGFRCCILKGQGNAERYPDPLLRMPGDIDVWIDAEEKAIKDYVKRLFPDAEDSFKHIKFPIFSDVPVDVHQTPLKLYNPVHNRRLQEWIKTNKDGQWTNTTLLTGTDVEISVPTVEFNAVYQLGHILIHLLDEGIGLRQLIDYFYVLKALDGIPNETKDRIRKEWKALGMYRLAAAVMWIEHDVLGLPERYLLTTPDKKKGRLLLKEILEGGNFGKYSQRQKYRSAGFLIHRTIKAWHVLNISTIFPGEAFFKTIFKLRTAYIHYMRK